MSQLETVPRQLTAAEEGVTVDVSRLVTEDDTPVDNPFSEKQMRLLTRPLHASWHPGKPFVAMANVGFYFSLNAPPLVPDALVSVDVDLPPELHEKEHRAYFTWLYGKVPDIAVEIVSNREGGELTHKRARYATWRVPRYVVFDPRQLLRGPRLQCFRLEFPGSYLPEAAAVFPEIGLGLMEWEGTFEGWRENWLRWVDHEGRLIPLGEERAAAESARADAERSRADAEKARADALAAKLRALGVNED